MKTKICFAKVFLILIRFSVFKMRIAKATECGAVTDWFVGH